MVMIIAHELEIVNGSRVKKILIKADKRSLRDWFISVIMLTHSSSELRDIIILDPRRKQRALLEIPKDQEYGLKVFGLNKSGKVIHEDSAGSNTDDLNLKDAENKNQIMRKLTPQGTYQFTFRSSDSEQFIFLTEIDTGEKYFFQYERDTTIYEVSIPLNPAKDYIVSGFTGSCSGVGRQYSISSVVYLEFRAAMHQRHVELLFHRAAEFCRSARRCVIDCLYRNKPHHYFRNILTRKGGLMTKYLKNDGGDRASPINRAIQGLFFSAYYVYSPNRPPYLPPTSPFGDQRLHVDTSFFLNYRTNLYFADFFCHYRYHHVTLVVTQPNSYSDAFCRQHLVALNQKNNPFLYYNPLKKERFTNTGVNIEVFYTENIHIGSLLNQDRAHFTPCFAKGYSRGKSFIGLKKNEKCQTCNLKPDEIN